MAHYQSLLPQTLIDVPTYLLRTVSRMLESLQFNHETYHVMHPVLTLGALARVGLGVSLFMLCVAVGR